MQGSRHIAGEYCDKSTGEIAVMFRDRIFNISFLISFCGHILCIFAFVLVITPKGFSLNTFSATAFLGPILEESIFQPSYNLRPIVMPTVYKEDFISSGLFSVSGCATSLPLAAYSLDNVKFEEPQAVKQIPDINNNIDGSVSFKNTNDYKDLKIEGPLSLRGIIYKPPAPALPQWAANADLDFSIDLRVFVLGDGVVQRVDRLTTTGYAEIDSITMKYAANLLFQPTGSAQEGKINILLGKQ